MKTTIAKMTATTQGPKTIADRGRTNPNRRKNSSLKFSSVLSATSRPSSAVSTPWSRPQQCLLLAPFAQACWTIFGKAPHCLESGNAFPGLVLKRIQTWIWTSPARPRSSANCHQVGADLSSPSRVRSQTHLPSQQGLRHASRRSPPGSRSCRIAIRPQSRPHRLRPNLHHLLFRRKRHIQRRPDIRHRRPQTRSCPAQQRLRLRWRFLRRIRCLWTKTRTRPLSYCACVRPAWALRTRLCDPSRRRLLLCSAWVDDHLWFV